ncbi:MAG: hypothetical protein D6820_06830, partial [Lentisphaerae bacterium]
MCKFSLLALTTLFWAGGSLLRAQEPSRADNRNRLRNGSFEGSLAYWPEHGILDPSTAADGSFSVRLEKKGRLRSGPFFLTPGKKVVISLWAKSANRGDTVNLSITPSNRNVGQKSGWAWNGKRQWRGSLDTSWKFFRWEIMIPAVNDKGSFIGSNIGWWNGRSWIMMIGKRGKGPVWVDGISVHYDGSVKT